MEDDIQYLGSRCSINQDSVSGIILHIESSSEIPAHTLTFKRETSSVIHIGRRPTTDPSDDAIDSAGQNALFRSAVVSRKHAKIAFSDSGFVYVFDLSSHHGTHIRKPGEAVSTVILPEIPIQLSDGVVLTFGKSVGRNDKLVRPVVARVELIRSPREPTFKPFTPIKSLHIDLTHSPPRRSSFGRFGVYVPPACSEDEDPCNASHLDDLSDIEDISSSPITASPLNPPPLINRVFTSTEVPEPLVGSSLEFFQWLQPPSHNSFEHQADDNRNREGKSISQTEDQVGPLSSPPLSSHLDHSSRHSSPYYSTPQDSGSRSSPSRFCSPPCSVKASIGSGSPPLCHFWEKSEHDAPTSPPCEDPSFSPLLEPTNNVGKFRSTSPMDLASPSPIPLLPEDAQDACVFSPVSTPSPFPCSLPTPPPAEMDLPPPGDEDAEHSHLQPPPSASKVMSLDAICTREPSVEVPEVDNVDKSTTQAEADVLVPEADMEPERNVVQQTSPDVSELYVALKKVEADVEELQAHKLKNKMRFHENLCISKLHGIDDRLSGISAQFAQLSERVAAATECDIPDLHYQTEQLQQQLDSMEESRTSSCSRSPTPVRAITELDEAKESVRTLRELVDEMRQLHETTLKQMATELQEVRSSRDAALAAIEEHVKSQTAKMEAVAASVTTRSLKRKRQDREDDDEAYDIGRSEDLASSVAANAAGQTASTQLGPILQAASSAPGAYQTVSVSEPTPHRRLKRARRFATVAMQTATAVTVGAVATWSMLAFS